MTPRIDAHQHFWCYTPEDYPWIGPEMAVLQRDFTPPDLHPLLHAGGFDGSIAVQARSSRDETEFLLELAEFAPWIRGVIGWADMRAPGLEAVMNEDTQSGPLKGYRHQVQDEPSPAACLADDAFNQGVAAVLRRGLVYEVLIHARDLEAATTFCARHEGRLVLDHLGKPDVRAAKPADWGRRIRPLARLEHVSCKLSGLITEAAWNGWTEADLRPYIDIALECFGPQRLMFGSDWPVCLVAGSYAEVSDLIAHSIGHLSADEQAAVWGGTACKVYAL